MRRNLKIGLILGTALFMLLPVYASAQMSLNNLSGGVSGTSVASIVATQGDTNPISFTVTSPLPNISMITPPEQNASFPISTNGTGTFTWNTSGFPAGSYVAVFESTDGGTPPQVEYLVAMIRISPSTGSNPTETINVSFASPPTSGTAGTPVTFTANAATSSLGTDTFQYNFIWGDGTPSTGFGTSLSANHTYNNTTTQSFPVTVQAKCSHGVIGQASVSISITGSGGGGGGGTGPLGSQTNPVVIDIPSGGYNLYQPAGQYTIPMGQTIYFKFDFAGTQYANYATPDFYVYNYNQTVPTMQCGTGDVCASLLTIDRATGQVINTYPFSRRQGNHMVSNNSPAVYFLVKITELGYTNMPMSVWWQP